MLNEIENERSPGPLYVSLELIAISWEVRIQMTDEICQRVLDRFGMPVEWALSIVAYIFMGKCDIRNGGCYRAVNLLEHGMMVVEIVFEKSLYN